MKAYVLTHCTWSSFGSILQSLGLKRALMSLGCQSEILYDRNILPFRWRHGKSLKQKLTLPVTLLHLREMREAYGKNVDFMTRNLDIRRYEDYTDLYEHYPPGGTFIAGSDQVWQPALDNPSFFLEFVRRDGERKISYAASMGVSEIPADRKERYREYLSDMDAISVREEEAVRAIREVTDKEIFVHADPTFLVSAEEWREYEEEYPVKKPYILVYTIYWNDRIKKEIVKLKEKTHLPVYTVKTSPSRAYADKSFYNVGVGEFLWLIDHAEYVVTSSFHGAAFSVIFNKKISMITNPNASSRFHQLERILQISNVKIAALPEDSSFDYISINNRIAEQRARGMAYLKDNLR